MDVMSQFMREDRFNFIQSKFVDERVAENDAARVADAGQRGVGPPRALAELPLEHPERRCAGTSGELNPSLVTYFIR